MKQIVQDIQNGETKVIEVPRPAISKGMVLVRTAASLVSPGTERSLVSFAESSLLGKARQRPDLVRQVLDKVRREGLLTTIEAVRGRLDEPMPLGYSSTGIVQEVGVGVTQVGSGDRVACGGGGFAVHAEYSLVPKNLIARLPQNVSFEQACFATLGSVALHGFRISEAAIGEKVAVIGLGLLGQLTMRIAQAAGCQVLGVDVSQWRVDWTKKQGFASSLRQEALPVGENFTDGQGFDAVLICADTADSDPVELAGELARDRAVIVALGAVGMDLPRRPYYDKELSFVVSRSYGPGRYDSMYEEAGIDYPIGYIRWPEGRNIQAMVDLMAADKLDTDALITHRFNVEQAPQAYQLISSEQGEQALAVLLEYPEQEVETKTTSRIVFDQGAASAKVRLGVVGAGNFATNVLLPRLKGLPDLDLVGVTSQRGMHSAEAARKFGFEYAATNLEELLEDDSINTLAVLTRHDQHAEQVVAGLTAGLHVFCEKPLAINSDRLGQVKDALKANSGLLTAGFNRRFAPLLTGVSNFFEAVDQPKIMHYRVNAGPLPEGHWLLDPAVGGGRLVGEGCHFVDALCYLTNSVPTRVYARALSGGSGGDFSLIIDFADGSVGNLIYSSLGDRAQGKERLEVFSGGKSAVLDDFRKLVTYSGGRSRTRRNLLRQDKGHLAIWVNFVEAIKVGGPAPIPYPQLFAVHAATLAAQVSLDSGRPVTLDGLVPASE